MDLTPELKIYIDQMNVYQLLYKVRFATIGDPLMTGKVGEYWLKRLAEVRDQDNGAYVSASKQMGW